MIHTKWNTIQCKKTDSCLINNRRETGIIILNEIIQAQKSKFHMIASLWSLQTTISWNLNVEWSPLEDEN